jgi:hypothetical protein
MVRDALKDLQTLEDSIGETIAPTDALGVKILDWYTQLTAVVRTLSVAVECAHSREAEHIAYARYDADAGEQ